MRFRMKFALASAVVASVCLLGQTASAVVIGSGDGTGNTVVTSGFADAFAHVGRRGINSAVYLGHGVVITANHVSGSETGNIRIGGVLYPVVEGSKLRLHDPNNTNTDVDLTLFRISGYTGLEPLTIGNVLNGTTVRMVGYGYDRATDPTYWNITEVSGDNNDVWTETSAPPPPVDATGYELLTSQTIRWGENYVDGDGPLTANTVTKKTTFDDSGANLMTHEAQAVGHDSGGGVFRLVTGVWQLVGILLANGTDDNQPGDTAVYGNETYFARLSVYKDQIDDYILPLTLFKGDANHDGVVDELDLIAVEQYLGTLGVADGTLPGDANHDGRVDGKDLIAVEQHYGDTYAEFLSALASSGGPGVPEPAAALLMLSVAPVLLARRRSRSH